MSNTLRRYGLLLFTAAGSCGLLLIMLVYRSDTMYYRAARWWGKMVCKIGGVHIRIDGATHLNEPCIYICNHRSLFDTPVVLAAIDDSIRIMYKAELGNIPVFGWMLRRSPFIAVNRQDAKGAVASLDAAVEQISQGASVLLFPEGTWSTTNELLPFKRGAIILATRSGKPIVPVALSGTEVIMPPDTTTFVKGNVHVRFGEAIRFDATTLTDRIGEKNAVALLQRAVQIMLDDIERDPSTL